MKLIASLELKLKCQKIETKNSFKQHKRKLKYNKSRTELEIIFVKKIEGKLNRMASIFSIFLKRKAVEMDSLASCLALLICSSYSCTDWPSGIGSVKRNELIWAQYQGQNQRSNLMQILYQQPNQRSRLMIIR